MSTLVLEPRKREPTQTEIKPVESLGDRIYVVLADNDRRPLTEEKPLADFAMVPMPGSSLKWNSKSVTLEVIAEGAIQRVLFIDADGLLLGEAAYSRPHPCTRVGDSIACPAYTFQLQGLDLC